MISFLSTTSMEDGEMNTETTMIKMGTPLMNMKNNMGLAKIFKTILNNKSPEIKKFLRKFHKT